MQKYITHSWGQPLPHILILVTSLVIMGLFGFHLRVFHPRGIHPTGHSSHVAFISRGIHPWGVSFYCDSSKGVSFQGYCPPGNAVKNRLRRRFIRLVYFKLQSLEYVIKLKRQILSQKQYLLFI